MHNFYGVTLPVVWCIKSIASRQMAKSIVFIPLQKTISVQLLVTNVPLLLNIFNMFFNIKGKIKVKLSLCLTKHHAIKTYWGSGGIAPRILDLGTRWS